VGVVRLVKALVLGSRNRQRARAALLAASVPVPSAARTFERRFSTVSPYFWRRSSTVVACLDELVRPADPDHRCRDELLAEQARAPRCHNRPMITWSSIVTTRSAAEPKEPGGAGVDRLVKRRVDQGDIVQPPARAPPRRRVPMPSMFPSGEKWPPWGPACRRSS